MSKEYQPAVYVTSLNDEGVLTFIVCPDRSFEDVIRDFKNAYAEMLGWKDGDE